MGAGKGSEGPGAGKGDRGAEGPGAGEGDEGAEGLGAEEGAEGPGVGGGPEGPTRPEGSGIGRLLGAHAPGAGDEEWRGDFRR